MAVALIADIVRSRALADRASAQRDIENTLERVARALPVTDTALSPVVGDELQGIYPDLASAIATTLLVRLALPEQVDFRFGIGIGEIEEIPSAVGSLSEGPAWWAARAAIEKAETLAGRAFPSARTWVACAARELPAMDATVRVANAGLLARDAVLGSMSARTRRLTFGRCLGQTQRELAEQEGITQSAVSQALATADAAGLVEGYRALIG